MSILKFDSENKLWIISHEKFLEDNYQLTGSVLRVKNIFNVLTPYRMDLEAEAFAKRLETGSPKRPKKRKNRDGHNSMGVDPSEISYIKEKYNLFIQKNKYELFTGTPTLSEIRENNAPLRQLVKNILNDIEKENETMQINEHGENTSSTCQIDRSRNIVLPPKCSFVNSHASSLNSFEGTRFTTITMDPPWENKYVKRKKHDNNGYAMMENEELGELPIDQLLDNNGLVFVWCSNCTRHREAVLDWFTKWKLQLVGKWFWLKVTKYGETVCEFSEGTGKQPYEVIFIGERNSCEGENSLRRTIPPDALDH